MRRVALLALLLAATPAFAQTGSLEDRLRGELRATKAALDTAQAQTAPLKQRADAAEKERDALKAQLAKGKPAAAPSTAEKARLAAAQSELTAARAKLARGASADQAQIAQMQDQLQTALGTVATMRTERDQALVAAKAQADASAQTNGLLGAAQAKNKRLLALSREILGRYAHVGFATVVAGHEPFIGRARMRIENEAETLGDRIYANTYDARIDTPKPATPEPAAAPPAPKP